MLLILGIGAILTAQSYATTLCVCTSETQRFVYGCQAIGMPKGILQHTTIDLGCMVALPNVQTSPSYLAGIVYNRVAYVKLDYSVTTRQCSLSKPTARITYDSSCPPVMLNGAVLNPTIAPPTTITPKPTPPTTTPTPTTPKPSPTPTRTLATVPTVKPSTKCDFQKLVTLLVSGQSAIDVTGQARSCSGKFESEAVLLHACTQFYDVYSWTQERKVVDHCATIPQGEPITVYRGAFPLEMSAVFWRCLPSGSFEVMYQDCNTPLAVVDIANLAISADLWYTISF